MKIRNGFVSNSSSSSFILPLAKLTEEQIDKINNLGETARQLGLPSADGEDDLEFPFYHGWNVDQIENYFYFETSMTNFNMLEFLKKLNKPTYFAGLAC